MRRAFIFAVFCLLPTLPLAAQDSAVLLYAGLPEAEDAHLSPDGRAVAMISQRDQRAAVRVWRRNASEDWFIPSGDNLLNWIAWKGDDHLLLSLRFTRHDGNRAVGATRLLITELASRKSVQVTFREPPPPPNTMVLGHRLFEPPNLQDRVVSLLPQDPDSILLSANFSEESIRPELMAVNIGDGRPSPFMRPAANIVKWLADPEGVVRLRQTLETLDGIGNMLAVRVRDDGRGDWRLVHRGVADRDPRFIPLAFAKGGGSTLYVLQDQDNGRLALRSFDVVSRAFGPVLAEDPVCDIEPVLRDNQLHGFVDPCRGPAETYLDSGWQQDQAVVRRALKTEFVSILDRSADGGVTLLRSADSATAPSTLWYFDQTTNPKTLTRLADSYPGLKPAEVAATRRITLPARDGTPIPALLTLPPAAPSGPLGFVMLPHGGPTAHDSEEFDWIVQFIAHLGYGVLQPQFRGSSGFGAAFQRAGYRQWGGLMQDDVTDATGWLIEQKLADPMRICIMGFSYGGYSALMGAALRPDLYQCAAALAPVTDLAELLGDRDRGEFGSVNRARTVGDEGVRPGQSPVERAAAMRVPVLLIHGRQDYTVSVSHSEAMEAQLKRAGKPVTALYLDQADHFLSRGHDRMACLRAIATFLRTHLGETQSLSPS